MISLAPFGHTQHESSRLLFGSAAFWAVTQAEADASMELVLKSGINHVDTAASYGLAEKRLGDWISRHGRPFFLATKTGERTAVKAREEFHRSLEKLHVDQVDLLQLHNLVDPDGWETALGPGGALEAAIEARSQGLVRFIGVTGHGLTTARMHLKALERFNFDSVLLPYNFIMFQNSAYLADFNALLAVCRERGVAVQVIKTLLHAPWGEAEHTRSTWYRPLEEQEDINRAVHWILGQPNLFLNTAGDIHLLPHILEAGLNFIQAPGTDEMQQMAERLNMQNLFEE